MKNLNCPKCGKEVVCYNLDTGFATYCPNRCVENWDDSRGKAINGYKQRFLVASNNGFNLTPPVDGAS